jgi:gamma-glutamylputrescine oxidase
MPRDDFAVGRPETWYLATANPHPSHPALQGDLTCDVAVVGGGFTGLSTALHLAGRGYDVVLLEANRIGWGASGRNGGQVVTGFSASMATVERLVGREDARRLWQMSEEAKALLREHVDRHTIRCDLRWGFLSAALKRRHLIEIDHTLEEMDTFGYDQAIRLDRDAVHQAVNCPAYLGGLLDHGSGQIHPLNYALGLADAALDAGVRIFEGARVTGLQDGAAAGTKRVRTASGSVTARYVALAGNAYLDPIAPDVRRRVQPAVMPVGTYILATEPLGRLRAADLIPSGVAVSDMNFVLNYYRLTTDNRMLFGGGVSYSGLQPPRLAHLLRRRMVRYFPSLRHARIDYCWGGMVAITMNRAPHFGRLAPNVFFAQGFSGHGVAITGLAGRLMAEAIAGTAERFDVFARIPHLPFPGGRLFRMPTLVLATAWFRLRDLL